MNKKEKNTKKVNKNKIMLTIVCIFVAIVLIIGVVLGVAFGVKNAKAALYYSGAYLTKEEASFFASYYKSILIGELRDEGVAVFDTESFWKKSYDGKITYGELLEKNTEQYLRQIVASSYLYDNLSSLSSLDKEKIETAVFQKFDFLAGKDKDVFNSMSEQYGFSYSDYEGIVEKLYKDKYIYSAVCGVNGENLRNYPEQCEKYFENYSHVKLLFIRTEDTFLLDENGNRVRDENNMDKLVELSEYDKAERQKTIGEIRAAIKAFEEDSSEKQMSPAMFNSYLATIDEGDPQKRNTGYYFSKYSAYSAEYSEALSEVVSKSLDMPQNSYSEVAFDKGVCFIYKYERVSGAYTDTSDGSCFEDFYKLAAEDFYYELMAEYMPKVETRDKFYELDLIKLPYTADFVPSI